MTEFTPPISERKTEELIEIVYLGKDHWNEEAISQSIKELDRRNISKNEQEKLISKWNKQTDEYLAEENKRLQKNKTESYEIWEMIVLFLFGPILFIKPYIFNSHTLFSLRGENYFLKFKQRILIFLLSFISWFFYANYSFKQSEKKRLEEIDKIDISDWKKEHGYE